MKIPKPRFELARVYADGAREVEIVPVTDIPLDTTTGRRGFLTTALTATVVLGITGCSKRPLAESEREQLSPNVEPLNKLPSKATLPKDPLPKERSPTTPVTKGTNCGELLAHRGIIHTLSISPDGRTLASGSEDKTIKLWDLSSGALRKPLEGHTGEIHALAFRSDSRIIALGSEGKAIKFSVLGGATGGVRHSDLALPRTLYGHSSVIHALAFSPAGHILASGSEDKTIKLWDLSSEALRRTFKGPIDFRNPLILMSRINWVQALAFSPAGHILASGSEDTAIKLWDLSSGALRHTLESHTGAIRALTFSPDGRTLASGSQDTTIKLWDLSSGALRRSFEGPIDFRNPLILMSRINWVQALAFSPAGHILASGSQDTTIKLWDLSSGALRRTFEGHTDAIRALVFSPDGHILVSCSEDRTIRLWDLLSSEFKACLTDFAATPSTTKGMTYANEYGQTYTLP